MDSFEFGFWLLVVSSFLLGGLCMDMLRHIRTRDKVIRKLKERLEELGDSKYRVTWR